jgi:hypothetical protein
MAKFQKQTTSTLLNRLELEAFRKGITPRTQESRDWFRKRAARLNGNSINRTALMNSDPLESAPEGIIGSMYMFVYDAKHKDTLPYWDAFPLIFVVGPAEGGFYGINMHYLPPVLRAKFLDALLNITNNDRYDKSTKLKLSYEVLKGSASLKYFQPCLKHYLNSQVRTQFAYVPSAEWEVALFLPLQQWQKAGPRVVYKESKKMVYK